MIDSEDFAVIVRWLMVLGSVVVIVLFVLAVLGIFPPRGPATIPTPFGPIHIPGPSNSTEPPPIGIHDFPDHFP